MALPDFLTNDLLPSGLHPSTEAEINDRCVAPFTGSSTRASIFAGLCSYRGALRALGIQGVQWVDGSFVDRSRLDPEDVDLANLIPFANLAGIAPANQTAATDLLAGGEDTKPLYSCHTFLVLTGLPLGHPMTARCAYLFQYWKDWFSKPQDYSDPAQKKSAPHRGEKGIVELSL